VKKQAFNAFAVVSRRGWLHRQVGAGTLLFDRLRVAKSWLEQKGDRIHKVRVTVEPVKPKRARGKK
jgi:hypothetical protein